MLLAGGISMSASEDLPPGATLNGCNGRSSTDYGQEPVGAKKHGRRGTITATTMSSCD